MKTSMIAARVLAVAAAVLAVGCANNTNVRLDPTYEEAAGSQFIVANRAAIDRLVGSLDRNMIGEGPVLVATVVNVNDLACTTPLGRTLSEQYASQLVANRFHVRELKLRGDVFVKEGTGELLLSREIKDIAKTHSAVYVVVGTYSAAANLTFVSLKMLRTEDGRIVNGVDYALPNDRDVQKLLQAPRS